MHTPHSRVAVTLVAGLHNVPASYQFWLSMPQWAAAPRRPLPQMPSKRRINDGHTAASVPDQTHLNGGRICSPPVDNHLEGVLDHGYGFDQLGHLVARSTDQRHLGLVDNELDGILPQGVVQGHAVHCVPVARLHSARQALPYDCCAMWRLAGILPNKVT